MYNTYKHGAWNSICDRCGFKFKNDELKEEWTGLRVCSPCHEVRHPQTLIKVPQEHINTAWARPEPNDKFVTVPYIAPTVGKQS